jgi:hypothetical protein
MGRVRPITGWVGQVRPSFFFVKRKIKKYYWNFTIFLRIFMSLWLISSSIFYVVKNAKSDIKISGFHQNFKNTKKFEKKKCFMHTAKCLKAKKSYCVFHTPKNNVLACNFDFNNQFSKVKTTLAKISKTTKNLFCLSFSIRGTKLHVMRILDINFFFNVRTVRFYPIKIRSSLLRRVFLES